ncbi:MAG: Gfo/Idh/MocA family oxidoreductase, partial [Phycisphaerae bacterium]
NIDNLAELPDVNIAALCDVDERRAGGVRQRFPKARFAVDYRRLLDAGDIDAVLVATPDHHHAPATLLALQAGKHVYCEKPLTHTVDEARLVAATAARLKRATQMGTQIHSRSNYRRVVEIIRGGVIGTVGEVHVWVDRQWGGQETPRRKDPVPEGLHWDLWIGPAPLRDYVDKVYTPSEWRGWWDFGGGTLGDMGCHYMDLPFWALGIRHPRRVAAEGPPVHPDSCPPWLIVSYEYPAAQGRPAISLTWYHGGKRPRRLTDPAEFGLDKRDFHDMDRGDGVMFVGSKGVLLANYDRYALLPGADFKDFKPPRPWIPPSPGHHREWVDACKGGPAALCHFGYAGLLTEAVLLGNVAYRVGKPIEWDHENLKAVNAPDADRFIRHEYRKEWKL